jgi:hypothetical protein
MDTLMEMKRDPSAKTVCFLNEDLTVLSPSEGISITRPDAASLTVADAQANGLLFTAATDPALVVESIDTVARLSSNILDLGKEDGVNVLITKV